MQAKRQKKTVSAKQPAWQDWVSAEGTAQCTSNDLVQMHDAIASLAYSYWEERGRQGGSAEEDWLRAEEKIRMR